MILASNYLATHGEGLTTRRRFLAGLAIAPEMVNSLWAKPKVGALLFVGTGTGTGSEGIYAYRFDETHGELTPLGLAAKVESPSFLTVSPDGTTLFAVSETGSYQGAKTGSVTSYGLNREAGILTPISTVASGGSGPCHLTTDHTGRVLVVANYVGGSAASFQIGSGGKLSEAVSVFHYDSSGPGPGQDKERQTTAHAHRATVSPDNRFVLINDLGLDRIHIYRLDAASAQLTANQPPEWKAAAGAGPRALRFYPNGRWAYCVNELTSTIDQLDWDATHGTLTPVAETALLPEGFHGATRGAEIIFGGKGKYAYAANRDDDFLATFKVDEATGKLSGVRRTPSGGAIPRHIALDPSEHWILAANQDSNVIAVYARDVHTGELSSNGKSFRIVSPQCLLFL